MEKILIPFLLCLVGVITYAAIGRKHEKKTEKFHFWRLGVGKLVDETDEESREIDKYSR